MISTGGAGGPQAELSTPQPGASGHNNSRKAVGIVGSGEHPWRPWGTRHGAQGCKCNGTDRGQTKGVDQTVQVAGWADAGRWTAIRGVGWEHGDDSPAVPGSSCLYSPDEAACCTQRPAFQHIHRADVTEDRHPQPVMMVMCETWPVSGGAMYERQTKRGGRGGQQPMEDNTTRGLGA
jgi:hypothetical protein